MYNAAALQSDMKGLVGFAPAFDPSYPELPAELLASDSGRILQYIHPLCTIENAYNVAPEFDKYLYPAWTAKAYAAGAIVAHSGKNYIAINAAAEGEASPDGNAHFKEYTGFADWLTAIYNASVVELFANFIRLRKLNYQNRTLLESTILYDGIGSFTDKIIKEGRFVFLAIDPSPQQGLQVQIHKLGLQADTAQDLTLYLYHSSALDAIATFDISVAKASTFNWQAINAAILKFYEATHNTSGSFYLGYYESDLSGQAFKREYNWITGPCSTCGGQEWNAQNFNKWSKYIKIRAGYVPASALGVDKQLFNESKVVFDAANNWGLNLALSAACDMTELFLLHKEFFADALAMQICIKILSQIAYTTRMNAIAAETKAVAMADIDAGEKDSFLNRFFSELEAVNLDFSGFNSACMPTTIKNSVRYSAV